MAKKVRTKYIWIDGKFVPHKRATVPVLSHSLHYGSAAFEGIRCYNTSRAPAVFRLDDHIKRLFHSARVLGVKLPYSRAEVKRAVIDTIKKNNLGDCYIRPIAYYGEHMGLSPKGAPVHLAVAAWDWGKYLSKESVRVKISPVARICPGSSVMTAKVSGHYANSIIAGLGTLGRGVDEALLLDINGNIAEGPGENIFFVKGKSLFTPRAGAILPGITRATIMTLADDFGFRVAEKDIKPKELSRFDEAFFVGTAAEVTAIGSIDDITFGSGSEGEATALLRETYMKAVRGEIPAYRRWLTFVD